MEMHQVRYFLAVADTLNFTRAAEQCHVSQPALTRAIQQLEEELGGLLLRRERRLTHLTDFGRLIEPHLRQLFADAEAAKTTTKRFLNMQAAELRLGVMCTIGPARFMGFLAAFRSANPGCEMTLVEDVPGGLSQMLLQGELDLAAWRSPRHSTTAWTCCPSTASGSASPFRPATGWSNKTGSGSRTSPARPICAGSTANTATILPTGCAAMVCLADTRDCHPSRGEIGSAMDDGAGPALARFAVAKIGPFRLASHSDSQAAAMA